MKTDVESVNEFWKVCKIGEGTYGEVYEARDTTNNRIVPMKKIWMENKDEGFVITALREMCIPSSSWIRISIIWNNSRCR
jgi:hypothetical protein